VTVGRTPYINTLVARIGDKPEEIFIKVRLSLKIEGEVGYVRCKLIKDPFKLLLSQISGSSCQSHLSGWAFGTAEVAFVGWLN
jgi:hypothetical protein